MGIPGQTGLAAFLTDVTCGEACWEAREDICRCSCGGKNHGVLRNANGERPDRTAKIDGYAYKVIAVSTDYPAISRQAEELNKAAGPYRIDKISETLTYTYHYHDTDKGAPARVKPASKSQIDRWAELTAWRNQSQFEFYTERPYILWQKL